MMLILTVVRGNLFRLFAASIVEVWAREFHWDCSSNPAD